MKNTWQWQSYVQTVIESPLKPPVEPGTNFSRYNGMSQKMWLIMEATNEAY